MFILIVKYLAGKVLFCGIVPGCGIPIALTMETPQACAKTHIYIPWCDCAGGPPWHAYGRKFWNKFGMRKKGRHESSYAVPCCWPKLFVNKQHIAFCLKLMTLPLTKIIYAHHISFNVHMALFLLSRQHRSFDKVSKTKPHKKNAFVNDPDMYAHGAQPIRDIGKHRRNEEHILPHIKACIDLDW